MLGKCVATGILSAWFINLLSVGKRHSLGKSQNRFVELTLSLYHLDAGASAQMVRLAGETFITLIVSLALN